MNLYITGSIAYDYLMQFPGNFRDHILPDKLEALSLSFLVESMNRQRGGTAPNIAYTLALFGNRATLFATAGEDFSEYSQWLEKKGVDTSRVKIIQDEFTASFFVNTDRSNSQIASFYPGAMAFASQLSFRSLEGQPPDLVVISPNDPGAMSQYVHECIDLNIPFIYDPSQQIVRLEADELELGISRAVGLCVNEYEYSLIESKLGKSGVDPGARPNMHFTIITEGHRGATITDGENSYHIPPVEPSDILDPTGVGDAFRGGFLTGYVRGWDLELCGQIGSLAATYCLEARGPQGQAYQVSDFVRRFRTIFDDHGRLDELLIPEAEVKSFDE